MPESYPFDHFMSVYGNAYKTIDVRMALAYENQKWNVFGLHIFIKIAAADKVTEAYNQKVRGRKINANKLKIIQRSIPYAEYQQVKSWLAKGSIALDDLTVTFHPVQGDSLNGRIDSIDHGSISLSPLNWPVIRTSGALSTSNPFYQLIQKDLEIVRDIECAGFVNLDDVIKTSLELENIHSQIIFIIDADIPARIESIRADKPELNLNSFEISVIAHQILSNFSVNITSQRRSEKQYLAQVEMQKAARSDDNQNWRGSFRISNSLEKDDRIEFTLVHKDIGYIGRSTFLLNELYDDEVRNPLLYALSYFCHLDDFRKMVHSAKGKPVADLKSDKKYEVTIQWLLSVAGFQTIWLNKHEELKVDDHLYGTVDCLAYSEKENMLLFVNCTLGNPSEKELSSYREVYYYFADNVFNNRSLMLYSIVFSNAKSPATVHVVSRPDEAIVYYKNQIDALFEAVINGREKELVNSILNPFFSTINR